MLKLLSHRSYTVTHNICPISCCYSNEPIVLRKMDTMYVDQSKLTKRNISRFPIDYRSSEHLFLFLIYAGPSTRIPTTTARWQRTPRTRNRQADWRYLFLTDAVHWLRLTCINWLSKLSLTISALVSNLKAYFTIFYFFAFIISFEGTS